MKWKLNVYLLDKNLISVPVQDREAANRRVVDIGRNGFTINLTSDPTAGFRYYLATAIDYIEAVPEVPLGQSEG